MNTPSTSAQPRAPTPDDVRRLADWLDQLRWLPEEAWGDPTNGTFPPEMIALCRWAFSTSLLSFPRGYEAGPVHALLRDPAMVRHACLDDLTRSIAFIHAKERHQSGIGEGHVFHEFIRGPHGATIPTRLRQLASAAGRPPVEDRQRGCLLGLFVGDALGAQVEFQDPDTIRAAHPQGVRGMASGGPHHLAAGQITDDGELAIALLGAVDAFGTYDPERAARGYLDWLDSGPFDIGGTIGAAVSAADAARQAWRPGQPPPALAAAMRAAASRTSQANGALMRLGGLVARGFRDPVGDAAAADAALTHPNTVCVDANRLMAEVLRLAILGVATGQDLWAAAMTIARSPDDDDDRPSYGDQPAPLVRPKSLAVEVMNAVWAARQGPPASCHGDRAGWVLIALQLAFWHLHRGSTVEEALVDVVGRGGDSDTNAAITGMLLGAAQGEQAIPAAWREAVMGCLPDDNSPQPRPRRWWASTAMASLLRVGRV